MIAANIGRTFLKAYNQKYKKDMTAKQFFEEEFVPHFYGGSKYMQWITNSPFVQGLSADPKGEYGVREKVKEENGKTMLFPTDSEAVKYFKKKIEKRSDFLYCLIPKYSMTNKATDYLKSISFDNKKHFRNILVNPEFPIENFYEQDLETNKWKISSLGIDEIKKQKFNCKDEALKFFSEDFVITKGHFQLKDNKKISTKGIDFIKTLNEAERKKLLNDFITKAENTANKNEFDGSIAIGFPASSAEEFAITSGLVSDIKIKYELNDIYLSWIGNGLGAGVAGGFSIFFNNPDILLSIYEGWKTYREILNDVTIPIVGKQIDTWNGQWLAFKHSRYSSIDFDFATLDRYKFFIRDKNTIKIDTIFWSKILFELSNYYSNKTVSGYIYTYGDINKTLGFYPFHFEKAQTLRSFYIQLFGEQAAIEQAKDYEALFGLHIKSACRLGSFGLQTLEPSSLRDRYGNFKDIKLTTPKSYENEEENKQAQLKDYENIIKYRTYKTWLLAMITKNKEENLKYSEEVAKVLLAHKQEARVEKKFIEEKLFKTKGKKQFLHELSELIQVVSNNNVQALKDLRDRAYTLSDEDFQYLFILIKFDFVYQERIANQ